MYTVGLTALTDSSVPALSLIPDPFGPPIWRNDETVPTTREKRPTRLSYGFADVTYSIVTVAVPAVAVVTVACTTEAAFQLVTWSAS